MCWESAAPCRILVWMTAKPLDAPHMMKMKKRTFSPQRKFRRWSQSPADLCSGFNFPSRVSDPERYVFARLASTQNARYIDKLSYRSDKRPKLIIFAVVLIRTVIFQWNNNNYYKCMFVAMVSRICLGFSLSAGVKTEINCWLVSAKQLSIFLCPLDLK